ncbi:pantothenate kinase 2 isoform X1 [Ziziphus jujuba]|uniref:Pantothenate kinase 2 n=2 Tax=Ziziphus jujuba TaxID=326968 RepID=A0ABM3III3_ZIZJJ|nr:pantothenate kinase 2 isoform X1 [Ziziphus jujuba]
MHGIPATLAFNDKIPYTRPTITVAGWVRKQRVSEVGVQRILGLMASLSEDPVVLGINDIKEKKEEETEIDNNNNKEHIDKVVVIGREEGQSGGGGQCGERDMAHPTGNPIHRSGSRPQLDLSKAAIQGNFEERNPTILLPNQSDDISHLALDIGGSLIKLVYFSRHEDHSVNDKRKKIVKERLGVSNGNRRSYPILGGRLHFVKFETNKLNECLDFISSKQLHRAGLDSRWHPESPANENAIIKATGGGAYKFADLFKERLGVSLDKEDEMDCLVAGANFLLKAIRHEAFTHMEGQKEFFQIDQNDLFPYLLVNIGSGVSMIKVDGDGKFQRVSGTNVGGGTYWGLGRLLTKCKSFDELLELSQRGDNRTIDMLVGDIYGGMDYSKIGLSASTIASSFGKAISENKELEDYRPEDISLSLLRMISYNIGQISYLNALRFGIKRIFFGGFFIRGHAYTMDTISFAVHFWSKGEAQAMFLRHEGFLGALGAFMSYEKHGLDDLMVHHLVERFPMGAPYTGGKIHGPPLGNLNEKISWMEKFVRKGNEIIAPVPMAPPGTTGLGGFEVPSSKGGTLRSDASALNVGVLHLVPTLEVFPLLRDPKTYEPNTIDLADHSELDYWFTVLSDHLPDLVDKAVASEGGTDDAKRRGDAFARAFSAHLARLMEEPAAYGKLGLANLLELREECLREFQFVDAYRSIKQRENEASLAVLPDLLMDLDSMSEETRLLMLIEGVLAANIFDWGSRACVDLYHKGTIIEIYRMSRNKMQRPWRVDDFDVFKERMLGSGDKKPSQHKRALLFVDNTGADIVLGMLPLARELLRRGTEVVLVANSLPALNDVTAMELPDIVAEAAKHCDILRRAAEAGGLLVDAMVSNIDGSRENSSSVPLMVVENGCGSPCIDLRQVSSELAAAAKEADLIILEGMGRALHTNFNAKFKCDALKLAMVKNQRLAEKLIKGNIYDCVCRYEPAN